MSAKNEHSSSEHTLPTLLALVFLPGIFMLLAPFWLAGLNGFGRTVVLSAYYMTEAILLMGIIFSVARKRKTKVLDVIALNRRLPVWQFIALAALGALWAIWVRDFVKLDLLSSYSKYIFSLLPNWPSIFSRLPAHDAFFEPLGITGEYLAVVVGLIAVSIASIAQSLYFRGFLLSRQMHRGVIAIPLIAILFAVFHLGSPAFWPHFLLLSFPWAIIAYMTRNVWVAVTAHVIMNGYGSVLILFSALAA